MRAKFFCYVYDSLNLDEKKFVNFHMKQLLDTREGKDFKSEFNVILNDWVDNPNSRFYSKLIFESFSDSCDNLIIWSKWKSFLSIFFIISFIYQIFIIFLFYLHRFQSFCQRHHDIWSE